MPKPCRCIPPRYLLKNSEASFAASISDVYDFPVESVSFACTFNPRSCEAFVTIALAEKEVEVDFMHCSCKLSASDVEEGGDIPIFDLRGPSTSSSANVLEIRT